MVEEKIHHYLSLDGQEFSCLSSDMLEIMAVLKEEFKQKNIKAVILALVKEDDNKIVLQTK